MRTPGVVSLVGIVLCVIWISSCSKDTPGKMVIDGQFDDWAKVPVLVSASPKQAPGFTAISMTHDENAIYLRLDLDAPVNIQNLLQGTLTLLFDADDNPETGSPDLALPGADVAIELSPLIEKWPGRPRQGIRLVVYEGAADPSRIESSYGIGFLSAPTHSSTQFEIRLSRGKLLTGSAPLFQQARLRGKLVYAIDEEHIIQQSPAFVYEMSGSNIPDSLDSQQIQALLEHSDSETLRVVAWNIADHNFRRNFDAFGRILATVKPDVLLLDEAPADVTPELIRKLLTAMAPSVDPAEWHVQIGRGGGRQRGVIASHLSFEALPQSDPLRYPEDVTEFVLSKGTASMQRDLAQMDQEGMPFLAVSLDWAGQKILMATMDFQCCGYDGSAEDGFRLHQANLVRQTLDGEMAQATAPGALVLAGDLNLVGSRHPLDVLLQTGQSNGVDMTSVNALQLDLTTTATYGISGIFPPGRLDFMLYDNASLELVKSFVFDSRDLPESIANQHGVGLEDSAHSSDHMPIVADFRFRRTPPGD